MNLHVVYSPRQIPYIILRQILICRDNYTTRIKQKATVLIPVALEVLVR